MTVAFSMTIRKGGTGKTTSAVTIGHALAAMGKRTLIVDLDSQGHVGLFLHRGMAPDAADALTGQRPVLRCITPSGRDNLFLIRADESLTEAAKQLNADAFGVFAVRELVAKLSLFDVIIFDTAPSDGILQQAALFGVDYVICPAATQFAAVAGVATLIEAMRNMAKRGANARLLYTVPTRYRPGLLEHKASLDDLQSAFTKHCTEPVHERTILEKCSAEGMTIWERTEANVSQLVNEADIALRRGRPNKPFSQVSLAAWEYARVVSRVARVL